LTEGFDYPFNFICLCYLTNLLNRSKPSQGLIHNVLFTTVSVLRFIFKFIVVIVVYIKIVLFLFYLLQIYDKVLYLPNIF